MISRSRLSQAGIPAHDPKVTRRRRESRDACENGQGRGVGEEPNAVWVRTTLVRAMIATRMDNESATATLVRIISPCGLFGNFDAIIICPRILLQGVSRTEAECSSVMSAACKHCLILPSPLAHRTAPPPVGKPQTTTHVPRPTSHTRPVRLGSRLLTGNMF